MRNFITASLLLLLVSGCPHDPNVDFYTTSEPSIRDLAGRYMLTSQSVTKDGLSTLAGKPSEIELREDGTFIATNVPPAGGDEPDEKFFSKLVSGTGTWKPDTVGSIANGGQPPKQHWGVSFDCKTSEIMDAGLTGSASPFGLLFTMGDPDGGHAMFFERAK